MKNINKSLNFNLLNDDISEKINIFSGDKTS
jgi:hypothetical protein